MKYDFAHPKFKNGMVTFAEKKPDLVYEFRMAAARRKYVLRQDMYLYNPNGEKMAKVENFGHMLLVTMLGDFDMGSHRIRTKADIESFFNMYESTEPESDYMSLNEAKWILKNNGFILD